MLDNRPEISMKDLVAQRQKEGESLSETVARGLCDNPLAKFCIQLIELVELSLGPSASVKNISNVIKSQNSLADFQATTSAEVKEKFVPFLKLDATYYEKCIAVALVALNNVTDISA
ncbi:hypothetical protein ACE02P_18220 [Shewanella bicestrii]